MKKTVLPVLAVVFASCATSPEITSWNMVKEVNTPAAYQDYIRRYPDSGNVGEAKERIETSKKERILKASTVAECVGVMKTNPDPKTTATVEDLAFKAAQEETSVEALYDFLEYFKDHSGAPAVRTRLEELEFEHAGKDASPAAMEYFLYRYPGSRFGTEGRKILQGKKFLEVKDWGNPYGYKAFLARFPDGPHSAEVRGWIKNTVPRPGVPNPQQALAEAVGKSASLKKYACVLSLSSAIRGNAANSDSLRRELLDIEKGTGSGPLPEMCASAGLKARPESEGNLAEALDALAMLEARRKDLAGRWEVCRQREEMVKAAVIASTNVANDLETAELSEEVLGSGPLGRMDIGAEKGSQSAKKALERFSGVQGVIRRDKDDIRRMLLDTDGYYKPLQSYVLGCVDAK